MMSMFKATIVMPDATPTNSSKPEVPPNGVALVVGGPPSDEAGCDGGGASVVHFKEQQSKCSIKDKFKTNGRRRKTEGVEEENKTHTHSEPSNNVCTNNVL